MIHPQQKKLMSAASTSGIETADLSALWSQDAVKYSYGGKEEVIFEGMALGSTPLLATTICNDLPIARHYLELLGIPSPKGKVFKLEEEHTTLVQLTALLDGFWVEGTIYACRPTYELSGHGVAGNLSSMRELELHLDTFADEYATWLIEEQVQGQDLQILVIDGKLTAAVLRSPLRLKGDGTHTLEELIAQHNLTATAAQAVEIDAETRQLLRDQSIFLSEIVPATQSVQLKNAGAGAGGATDVTSNLHPRYTEWCTLIARKIGLQLFSIDCKCMDVTTDPLHNTWVTQLNARPEWDTFTQTDQDDLTIAKLILKAIFGV